MRTIPDKFFDLAVCDPPYGINAGKMTMGSGVNRSYSHDKDWDAGIPGPEYFEELFRVSREQIIFGGNYFPLPLSEDWIVWDKMNDGRSFSEAELAWCSVHRKMRIFHFRTTTPVKGGKIHPTQKPVELYSWIFANYARGSLSEKYPYDCFYPFKSSAEGRLRSEKRTFRTAWGGQRYSTLTSVPVHQELPRIMPVWIFTDVKSTRSISRRRNRDSNANVAESILSAERKSNN